MKKAIIILFLSLFTGLSVNAQLTYGVTGLLHAPNAEMQRDATVMIGGNYLDKKNLPNKRYWYYNTYNYYINITFLSRLEMSYICTLVKGTPGSSYWPDFTWDKFVNQDRHFAARLQIMKECDFSTYMPSIVVGISDPTSGSGGDYSNLGVKGSSNGYFNRWYLAATKHIPTRYGELGIHIAYLWNKRTDYPLNGPALGINLRPYSIKGLNTIIEYDSKTVNIGAIYSLWHDHFNILFELQNFCHPSFGITYKVNLKGGNNWSK